MKQVGKWGVAFICCAIMVCEGVDLVVYGNLIPSLLVDASISVDKSTAGIIGSLAFAGMFVGGLTAGRINTVYGSKCVIVGGVICFSIAMLLVGLSVNVTTLAIFRFITGVGLGVVLPVALTLARSKVSDKQAPLMISIVMAGIPIGGSAAALSVSVLLNLTWRAPMIAASVVGFAVAMFALAFLPQRSVSFQKDKAGRWKDIFGSSRIYLLAACAFATFCDLFSYYGVTTWLTQLMREFDIPLEDSLQLALTLNVGAVIGSIAVSFISLHVSAKRVAILSGALACVCLWTIATHPSNPVVLVVLTAATGAFSISAQNHLNALVANAFPPQIRSSALGFTLGTGRLGAVFAPMCGGTVLQMGYGASAVLICFGMASLAGCLSLAVYTEKAVVRCREGSLT